MSGRFGAGRRRNVSGVGILLGALGGLAACGDAAPPSAPPPPAVTVSRPIVRDVPLYSTFTGRTRAVEAAEIRARVSGELREIYFSPGGTVVEGDTLFLIEPEFYEAVHREARAGLEAARAEAARAEADLARLEIAVRTDAVSQAEVDRARALRDQAVASVSSAEARLARAELDVGYTRVTTPTSGVVGRSLVDPGNLVGPGASSLLTTVNQVAPIHVYFNAPESAALDYRRRVASLGVDVSRDSWLSSVPDSSIIGRVAVATAIDDDFPHMGRLDFIDNAVDPATGTIEMRATLPNESGALLPGLFVRLRVYAGTQEGPVLVPETAISRDLGGSFVLRVGDDDIVERVYVQLGPVQDDRMVVVEEGIGPDDRIVTAGLLRARPGFPVTPEEASASATPAG